MSGKALNPMTLALASLGPEVIHTNPQRQQASEQASEFSSTGKTYSLAHRADSVQRRAIK